MNRDAKRIDTSSRMNIITLKSRIRSSTSPFDGTGHPFRQAVSELRKEGIEIIYDKQKCRYYNPATIAKIWGY